MEWDEIDDSVDETSTQVETETQELFYGSVDDFVANFLIHAYKRPVNGRTSVWAAQWWKFDEAIMRLEALWRAWEHLRLDASLGMSTWWRDHADHHMDVLLHPDGPFASVVGERENSCKPGEPLPYEAPPPGLFPDVRVIEE